MDPIRATALAAVEAEVVACRACPRLVAWREQVAAEKRAAFRDDDYWGRPVPGFGDPDATVVIVGLAPAAHGANRTGRMFTGDRSGDFLYAALHRAGFANQPESVARDDGLRLTGAWITAPVRCAPPANKPTTAERDACRPFLERELALLEPVRVFVPLGGFAYEGLCRILGVSPRPRVRPRRRGGAPATAAGSSAATTSASRTPSPASSPSPCSTPSSSVTRSPASGAPARDVATRGDRKVVDVAGCPGCALPRRRCDRRRPERSSDVAGWRVW